jgi:hypothetical protein
VLASPGRPLFAPWDDNKRYRLEVNGELKIIDTVSGLYKNKKNK